MRRTAVLALSLTLALGLTACASDADPGDSQAAGGSLAFVGTDDVAWAETETSTGPGTVEVTIECGEAVNHGVAIEGVQGGAELAACDAGGADSTTVELDAGEYTFFCTVPGHRDAGMEGTVRVG